MPNYHYSVKERRVEGSGPAIGRKFSEWKILGEFDNESKALSSARSEIKKIIARKDLKQVAVFHKEKRIKTLNPF